MTTPALVYHAYLMSEALAYPVFLVTVAVLLRAVTKPSRAMAIAVPLVCLLAVATSVQFLALPLVYLAAVALCGRGDYRRHLLPAASRPRFVALVLGVPGALGQYGEATHLGYAPRAVAHWALVDGSLLPYSVGLAIVMGAVFGLGFMLTRPERKVERAFAVLAISCTSLFMGQAALIAAVGEATARALPLLFTPLLFIAFFRLRERGVPRHVLYLALRASVHSRSPGFVPGPHRHRRVLLRFGVALRVRARCLADRA